MDTTARILTVRAAPGGLQRSGVVHGDFDDSGIAVETNLARAGPVSHAGWEGGTM